MAQDHYTVTGNRLSPTRGWVSFYFEIDADSEEEAVNLCRKAFGTWDVSSGTAIPILAELSNVTVWLDSQRPTPDSEEVEIQETVAPLDETSATDTPAATAEESSQEPAKEIIEETPASDSNG